MKDLQFYGRLISCISLLLLAIFEFTKYKTRWPVFLANNIFYICLGITAIGYILLYIHYTRAKDPKKAKELVIFAVVIVAFFGLVKLISK